MRIGEIWTPTPLPAGAIQPYRVKHGAGYTIFEHNSHGLRHVLTLFASPEDPVKIIHLKVENTLDHSRRITATQYVEWVLGTTCQRRLCLLQNFSTLTKDVYWLPIQEMLILVVGSHS